MQARLLITGGIGSGKSAVGRILQSLGVRVIDADQVGHEVLDNEAYEEIAASWPSVVLRGRVDRKALANIVFSDIAELRILEGLTHPHIRHRIEDWSSYQDGPAGVEAPVLFDWLGENAVVVVVTAEDAVRRERLRRRGLSDSEIDRRMAAQPDQEAWTAAADEIVENSGDLDDLRLQVHVLAHRRGWIVTPTD